MKIYLDGDLRVEIRNVIWTINPACVALVQNKHDVNNTMTTEREREQSSTYFSLVRFSAQWGSISMVLQHICIFLFFFLYTFIVIHTCFLIDFISFRWLERYPGAATSNATSLRRTRPTCAGNCAGQPRTRARNCVELPR